MVCFVFQDGLALAPALGYPKTLVQIIGFTLSPD